MKRVSAKIQAFFRQSRLNLPARRCVSAKWAESDSLVDTAPERWATSGATPAHMAQFRLCVDIRQVQIVVFTQFGSARIVATTRAIEPDRQAGRYKRFESLSFCGR